VSRSIVYLTIKHNCVDTAEKKCYRSMNVCQVWLIKKALYFTATLLLRCDVLISTKSKKFPACFWIHR